ncbi:hypothetical protein D9757_003042 [Collybiopsis confluens]|uniref:NAD-dependent epimerase/dehydratase domain-containing protein n=1 Tax=Collybiopsis confluens TaxID=2823264 RepID=A0A8H5HXE6_9AGAR|nr:hypothetical protein D9757_003042 [Collybiopsis confluens]
MPTVPAGSGNGYIAAWIVRLLLEKGYIVRATARTEEKCERLKQIFPEYQDTFETVVVEDITKEGAFDEALKGIDAVEHTASPFHFKADDPQGMPFVYLIGPAVNGTLGVLKSALKVSSIKRIVVTSSAAAIQTVGLPERKVFSELDWNQLSIDEVNQQGKNASQPSKYRASKSLAEKAAWDFYEKHKASVSWDLVVFNPPFVFGPIIHDISSPSALGTSAGDWYNSVVKPDMGGKSLEVIGTVGGGWVDVRDIALAHALALQKEEAADQRLIISNSEFVYQDFLDIANSLSPSPIPSHTDLPKGNPGAGKDFVPNIAYDASKASRILGPELRYHTMEETTRDTLADFERRGW